MNRLGQLHHLDITGWHLLAWIVMAAVGLAWCVWGLMNFSWYVRDLLVARTAYYRLHTHPPAHRRHSAEDR